MIELKRYSDNRLDFFGDELNRRFDSQRLEMARPLDVYDVVDFIGCIPDWKFITPDQSILGMTIFESTNFYVWKQPYFKNGDIPEKVVFEKKTIVIDRTLNEGNKQQRLMENFTVVHECFHWLLHKYYFEFSKTDCVQCCTVDSLREKNSSYNLNIGILEHQANRCASSFLMPRNAVINEFMSIARMKNFPQQPMPCHTMKKYIAKTAESFGVNFNPMKYRLQDIGLIQK